MDKVMDIRNFVAAAEGDAEHVYKFITIIYIISFCRIAIFIKCETY